MRPVLIFVLGVVASYYGWAALLTHYAESSDITVRGAIFWLGGMVMPFIVLVGGLMSLLVECLYERYLERRSRVQIAKRYPF